MAEATSSGLPSFPSGTPRRKTSRDASQFFSGILVPGPRLGGPRLAMARGVHQHVEAPPVLHYAVDAPSGLPLVGDVELEHARLTILLPDDLCHLGESGG